MKQETAGTVTQPSAQIRRRAERVLVPGSQDYLRFGSRPEAFPLFFEHAEGPYLWDPDGRRLTDFYLGSGTVILGHGHPGQTAFVREHLAHGATVSLRHPVEVEVAEILHRLVPSLDRFMFFKTGSECAHLALRTALAATRRTVVATFGYHGWISPFDHGALDCRGVRLLEPPWCTDRAVAALRDAGEALAAVFISPSPMMTDPTFYQAMNEEAHRAGTLFIMDEIKSGFRWAFPCFSRAFGLEPDLVLFAKAMTNGFPLAVMGGVERLLGKPDLISLFSTFASENVALFAAKYCLSELASGAFERFQNASRTLYELLEQTLHGSGCRLRGVPTFFRLELPAGTDWGRFAEAMIRRGVLHHPKDEVLVSASHNDPILLAEAAETFRAAVQEVLE